MKLYNIQKLSGFKLSLAFDKLHLLVLRIAIFEKTGFV